MIEEKKEGYKGLFKGIKDQVQAEKENILKAAKREADQIIQNAQVQVEKIEKGEEDENIIGKKRLSRRRIPKKSQGRAQFLAARWDANVRYTVFQEVLQKAKKCLGEVKNRKDYPEILTRLIKEAVEECDGCDAITVYEKDLDLAQKLAKKLDFQQKISGANNFSGGAIATAFQGKIKVDNTLDARIEQAIPLVITEIGNILYGSSEN